MKRFIIPLVFLLCLFWFVGTCSYANSVDYSNFDSYNYNGDILDFFKQCFEFVTDYNFDDNNWVTNGTNATDRLNSLLDGFSNDNYQYIVFNISDNASTGTYYNGKFFEVIFYKTPPANGQFARYSGIYRKASDSKVNITTATASTSSITINGDLTGNQMQKYLINKNNSNVRPNQLWYKSKSNNQSFESSLKYTSNKTQLINVNNNGVTGSMIKADYNLNGYINIGRLQSYTSYNELQGYLGVFSGQSNVDNANYYDTIATFQYNKSNNTQLKNNLRLDYDTGDIYINSIVLAYNHAYSLYFTGDGTDTTTVVNYYFVPYGSSASSGDINTDNPTGLDFDFINSIEYVSNSDSGDIAYIVGNNINSSGEPFNLHYSLSPDSTQTQYGFLHNVFNGVIDTFLSDNDVTLNISVHSFDKVLRSSDFITPNGPIKAFCALFLVVGTFMLLFQQITAIYLSIGVLDVNKFLHSADVDFTFFM